jgi:hypothetical protein
MSKKTSPKAKTGNVYFPSSSGKFLVVSPSGEILLRTKNEARAKKLGASVLAGPYNE